MGQIASYKYPDIEAQLASEIADVLVNEYGGEATSEAAFAQALGHSSAKSGAFKSKMADARKWGVVSSRGLEATELAYRLANPRDSEAEQETKFEMYQNVQILRDIYEHLDGKQPPPEFWRVLEEVTGTNPKEAKEAAKDLRGLYKEMLDYDSDEQVPANEADETEIVEETVEANRPEPSEDGIYVSVGSDVLDLSDVNGSNIELARMFLESKKREMAAGSGVSDSESEKPSQQELPTP